MRKRGSGSGFPVAFRGTRKWAAGCPSPGDRDWTCVHAPVRVCAGPRSIPYSPAPAGDCAPDAPRRHTSLPGGPAPGNRSRRAARARRAPRAATGSTGADLGATRPSRARRGSSQAPPSVVSRKRSAASTRRAYAIPVTHAIANSRCWSRSGGRRFAICAPTSSGFSPCAPLAVTDPPVLLCRIDRSGVIAIDKSTEPRAVSRSFRASGPPTCTEPGSRPRCPIAACRNSRKQEVTQPRRALLWDSLWERNLFRTIGCPVSGVKLRTRWSGVRISPGAPKKQGLTGKLRWALFH